MYASLFTELDRLQRPYAPGSFPALNVGQTPASVEVQAFAPGLDPAQIEVTLDRGVLTLAGERSVDQPERQGRRFGHSQERAHGRFRRAISLPDDIDPAQVSAKYTDGVLHVSVGRKPVAQPQRIQVR